MKLIRAPTLSRAHELVVRYILEKGYYLKTENGEETMETDEICISVDHYTNGLCYLNKWALR